MMSNLLKATVFASALAIPMATTAEAQGRPPVVIGGGLVNVQITDIDVLSGNTVIIEDINVAVGVAAGIAANVCVQAVNVGVLSQQLARGGNFACEAIADGQHLTITQR
jgi:hypothetical protein